MVLIFSNRQDPTTDLVIEWLIAFGVDYHRINSEDLTDPEIPFYGDAEKGKVLLQGSRDIDSERSPVRVCWYRRWNRFKTPEGKRKDPFVQQLRWETQREAESISRFLFDRFKELPWLTDPAKAAEEEKILTLRIARKKGLRIPKSIISNRREQVLQSFPENERIVAKPLSDPSGFIDRRKGRFYRVFAESLDRDAVRDLPSSFFPSFFQERVEKSHEIRAFFLDGIFYPTALFTPSSKNADIKIDNGLEGHLAQMNRTVLPRVVERRLTALMQELGLNSGSIDLLVRPDGEHVFLEVNPVGQFIGYGEQANHALDRRIAVWLMQKDQDHEFEEILLP
jgi:hypothetical protein